MQKTFHILLAILAVYLVQGFFFEQVTEFFFGSIDYVVSIYDGIPYTAGDFTWFIFSQSAIFMFCYYAYVKSHGKERLVAYLLSILAFGKIVDNITSPFCFHFGECTWIVVSILLTYKLYRKQVKDQKQNGKGHKGFY